MPNRDGALLGRCPLRHGGEDEIGDVAFHLGKRRLAEIHHVTRLISCDLDPFLSSGLKSNCEKVKAGQK